MSQNLSIAGIASVIAAMKGAGMPDADVQAYEKQMMGKLVGPIYTATRDALMTGIDKLTEKIPADTRTVLNGKRITFTVNFTETGVKIEATSTEVRRSTGEPGKRPVLIVDGLTFTSYESLCQYKGLNTGADSAKRVWERANRKDSQAYPVPVEVDGEAFEANKEALTAEHKITGPYLAPGSN